MKVSVIIPCHNAGPYLGQAIGSALEQTHPAHEIIVVDDGSTDDSLAIALQFQAAEDTVRVLSEHSGSAARTRNLGALAATGDALLFLDADDVLSPDALAALVQGLGTEPSGVAICPWYRLERVAGRWVQRPASCRPRRGEDPLAAWLTGWYHPPCSVLWSRDAFEHVGRWEETWSPNDDGDLMMRALAAGIPLVEVTSGAGYYRRIPEGGPSLSGARTTPEGLRTKVRVIEKIAWWLEDRDRLDAYRTPIGEALDQIARDAAGHAPDAHHRAEELARRFGPARLARGRAAVARTAQATRQRLRRGLRRVRAVVGPGAAGEEQEITFGTERARRVASADVDGSGPQELERPRVSVIIPTYNRAALLRRALDSVLGQTMQDLEVLVVDDGSTDGTREAITAYDDPRIRYLRQAQNRGVAAARNRGLRAVRGEFIAFLDSDDEWLPGKLEEQLEVLAAAPEEVGLVYGAVEEVDGGSERTPPPIRRGDVHRELLVRNVLHGGGSAVMIRRRVVATVGFFDEDLPAIEDHDYWLRIARFFHVDAVDRPVVRYHDPGPGGRKSLEVRKNLEARLAFYRKHRAEMRRAGAADDYLLVTARRHLSPMYGDRRGGRKAALLALRESPRSAEAFRLLLATLVPPRVLRRRHERRSTGGRDLPQGMRLLLYSPTDPEAAGGVQAVVRQLAEDLRDRGHEVQEAWSRRGAGDGTVVYPLVYPLTDRSLPVPGALLPAVAGLLRLAAGLLRFRPQVVNVHYLQPEIVYFLWLRRLLRYEVVLSLHGSDVFLPWHQRAARRYAAKADALTAVTPALAEHVGRWPGIEPEQMHVVPNAIDLGFWSSGSGGAADVARREPRIVSVGRLHHVKGHDVLLRALPEIRREVPGAQLVIVGDGPLRTDLEELARDLGVTEAVTFAGRVTPHAVRARMNESRVFALPSRSEGMPLSLLEAMAAGLPVVASDVGGIRDGVAGEGVCVLVPADDPSTLAVEVTRILLDDARATEMSEAARHWARELDVSDMSTAYERVFAHVRGVETPVAEDPRR